MSDHNFISIVKNNTEVSWQCNNIIEALPEHDRQVRDETIDEFVQKFNSCVPTKNCRDKDCAECVAEQMKVRDRE